VSAKVDIAITFTLCPPLIKMDGAIHPVRLVFNPVMLSSKPRRVVIDEEERSTRP
jgi:hypothetical protein